MSEARSYLAIDLKSFYASVECMERGLDPMATHLVVADVSRTEKTICLAVSPSLKAYGISGRARLFQVVQRVREVNEERRRKAPGRRLCGKSCFPAELKDNPSLALSYLAAPPRMALYLEYSSRIYDIYLKYIAPEDIHVYSIDEVLIDATEYLDTYRMTARELAKRMIQDILETTGITAAAGIGTNLYLCKVAMDIVAKHEEPDAEGVRIAELDERSYRRLLWNHRPLTDFWRVGPGYARKLEEAGLYTMGDIARCSLGKTGDYHNEELLYRMFGINAELLIDHAWGWEPCTIADIRAYQPEHTSICSGQVLPCAYSVPKARLVVQEMADNLALSLLDRRLVTDQIILTIGYDSENTSGTGASSYRGEVTKDRYGRAVPKHGHGTIHIGRLTSSARLITEKALELYDRITDSRLSVRRITITAGDLKPEGEETETESWEQLDLFTDYEERDRIRAQEEQLLEKEKRMQEAVLQIKKKFGKNSLLKGMNLQEGATAKSRNEQIGGHKA